MFFEKAIHLPSDTEDEWSGIDLDFLVDEPGGSVEVEIELTISWQYLFFKQLLNVSSFLLTSLNHTSHFVKERSIFFILLDGFSGMDKGYS